MLKTCNQFFPAVHNPEKFQSVDSADEVIASFARFTHLLSQIIYSYDVKWEPSDLSWANRWDVYLKGNPNDEIHYFSIVNSLMIVLFLTGVVAMIMLRTLRKDITAYNEIHTLEEAQEESGWKLVHGDVFRPPSFPLILSVLAGTGKVLFLLTLSSLRCSTPCNGRLNPLLCCLGASFPFFQGIAADHPSFSLRLHGITLWISLCPNL